MKKLFCFFFVIVLLFSVITVDAESLNDDTETEYNEYLAENHVQSVLCNAATFYSSKTWLSSELAYSSAIASRETAALTLYRLYREKTGIVPSNSSFHSHSDSFISAEAQLAAEWCCSNGILTCSSGLIQASAPVTKGDLSLALSRFCDVSGQNVTRINQYEWFLDEEYMSAVLVNAAHRMQQGGVILQEQDGCYHAEYSITSGFFQAIMLRFAASLSPVFSFESLPVSSVCESEPVSDSYFNDACFIGHSQVVGMDYYFKLDNADFYSFIGFTAQQILDCNYFVLPNGRLGTIEQALKIKQYGKVYVMLGINDCSLKDNRIEEFMSPMRSLLNLIYENQPSAKVYLLSLVPVGRYTPNNMLYNPENTLLYTQAVKTLSREYHCEYLDLFRLMTDGNGYMLDSFNAGDSIHIQASEYSKILAYIKSHT